MVLGSEFFGQYPLAGAKPLPRSIGLMAVDCPAFLTLLQQVTFPVSAASPFFR